MRLTSPLNLPEPGRRQCVYGALCGLARTCVFAKQSLGPIHCGPAERSARGAVPRRASLLPKLRDQYAEFLDHVSLVHLRLLASPTCVGFRYGHLPTPQPAFLARRLNRSRARPKAHAPHQLSGVFEAPYGLRRSIHKTAPASFRCPWWFDVERRGRNVNRLSIGYAFGASP